MDVNSFFTGPNARVRGSLTLIVCLVILGGGTWALLQESSEFGPGTLLTLIAVVLLALRAIYAILKPGTGEEESKTHD